VNVGDKSAMYIRVSYTEGTYCIVLISFGEYFYGVCCNLCNVWMCVCVGILLTCVLVFTLFFCIVLFMHIYSYLFCLC
jgi:hypothetical protein